MPPVDMIFVKDATGTQREVRTLPAVQNVSGSVAVTNWPASSSVSGAFLTDAQLRATPVDVLGSVTVTNWPAAQAVTGVFWPAVQPVSGPLTDSQLRATPVPVSGTFWQAT